MYKTMLPRITSRVAASLLCDKNLARIEIGQFFLGQNFLDGRIDGLKIVSDVCNSCLQMLRGGTSALVVSEHQLNLEKRKLQNVDRVVEKMCHENALLNEVFSKERTHSQLVQRSEKVLRLLMAKEALEETNRELVWDTCNLNDGDLMIELFKVLIGAAPDMRSRDREFFIDKIEQIPP